MAETILLLMVLENMVRLLEAVNSDKRLIILNLMAIHRQLSLSDLANMLELSKPAVHHHLKILRDAKLVTEVGEEPSRGSIPQKYFGIAPHQFFVEDLRDIGETGDRFRVMKLMVQALQSIYTQLRFKVELALSFTKQVSQELETLENPNADELEEWQERLERNNTHLRYLRFSEHQFQEYRQAEQEFVSKVNRLRGQTTEPLDRLVILADMPIRQLIDEYTP